MLGPSTSAWPHRQIAQDGSCFAASAKERPAAAALGLVGAGLAVVRLAVGLRERDERRQRALELGRVARAQHEEVERPATDEVRRHLGVAELVARELPKLAARAVAARQRAHE